MEQNQFHLQFQPYFNLSANSPERGTTEAKFILGGIDSCQGVNQTKLKNLLIFCSCIKIEKFLLKILLY